MEPAQFIYPMCAMFMLTFAVLVLLFTGRVASVRSEKVRAAYFLTYSTDDKEPYRNLAMSQNFKNLFEAPVLFYVVCLAVIALHCQSAVLLGLAWGFVLMRLLHTAVHLTTNHLILRIGAYMASWVCLLGLWIGLVLTIS